MDIKHVQLSRLIDQTENDAVHAEIIRLAEETSPGFNSDLFCKHFNAVVNLYAGKYEGYKACNTQYHDLGHTIDVTLASARIIHGAAMSGHSYSADECLLVLIAALLHDTGYIQTVDDTEGTGAKYTTTHVVRSISFAKDYCEKMNCEGMFSDLEKMILATELMQNPDTLFFKHKNMRELANILGSADLIGQMANRCYLEKLLYLYYEFLEGKVKGYSSEKEMLEKTTGFYKLVIKRLDENLGNVHKYLDAHFKKRWGIESNLYHETVKKNMDYLSIVISKEDHRKWLRRGNIVNSLPKIA